MAVGQVGMLSLIRQVDYQISAYNTITIYAGNFDIEPILQLYVTRSRLTSMLLFAGCVLEKRCGSIPGRRSFGTPS